MDINLLNDNLKNYNCEFISSFIYNDIMYVKALKFENNSITYKYFKVNDSISNLEEVLDNNLINYFDETQGFSSDVNY